MKKAAISVTEAARNFAHCINRVRYQNVSFILMKNGRPFARLVPESDKICTGAELSAILADTELSPDEAREWRKDLLKARKTLKSPDDKWR